MENLKCMICVLLSFTYNEFIAADADDFDCNFDDGFCNWKQDKSDDFDWNRSKGGTPNLLTGPKFDHTSEGHYVFIDTSENRKKHKARIISPLKSYGQYCFSFWYYMYGEHVDRLKISIGDGKENKLFETSHSKGPMWILKQVYVNRQKSFKIIIEGRVKDAKDHDLGDIAIDDIVMFQTRSNSCPEVCERPVPDFGIADLDNFNIGSVVHIGCHSGYKLTGTPTIVCQVYGNWSDRPECKIVDCGIPTFNREIIGDMSEGTHFNMIIILDCEEGFTLIGNAYVTCMADGNWTTQPKCVINNCSDPTPESGIVDKTNNFVYGTVIEVACIQGYKIIGNSSITCLANSTWSDNPRCEQIDCKSRTITNGKFNATFGTIYGQTARQSCERGYSCKGNKTVTCLEAGWNGSIATCTIVDCSVPFLANGIFAETLNGTTYNTSAVLACVDGFSLSGNASVTCQADGTWAVLPQCIIEDSEASAVIAVYVTVPFIVIFLAIVLTVNIWRKRHTRSAEEQRGQNKTDINQVNLFPNVTYNERALTKQSEAETLQQDQEYAIINDDHDPETIENVYYNTYNVECISQNDVQHHYDHAKITSTPVQDKTYSHVHGKKLNTAWAQTNDITPTSYDNKGYQRPDVQSGNDSYDHVVASDISEGMNQEHLMIVNDNEEAEYDHAKAGGKDPVPFEQDDYSHLRDIVNQESTEKEMHEHDKYGYFNVDESTGKIDKTGNIRNAEYEQPIGHSPQYFILEAEADNTHEDDRTKIVLEAEEKSDENYESYNHTYFALEKTESA